MARSTPAPAHSPVCPPLPPGCVDFDALHAAALRGEDLAAVIAPAPAPEPEPEQTPASEPAPEPDTAE